MSRLSMNLAVFFALAIASAASAQVVVGGAGSGTFSHSTGSRAEDATQVVRIESGVGPYRRATFGTGRGLAPQQITYLGSRLGLPASLFPVELTIEFCDFAVINEALLNDRCPTFTWALKDRPVFLRANYEPINIREADDLWFDPFKKYVLIWRDRQKVIRYSTPVMFAPKTP